jgi:hypothetical protein
MSAVAPSIARKRKVKGEEDAKSSCETAVGAGAGTPVSAGGASTVGRRSSRRCESSAAALVSAAQNAAAANSHRKVESLTEILRAMLPLLQ